MASSSQTVFQITPITTEIPIILECLQKSTENSTIYFYRNPMKSLVLPCSTNFYAFFSIFSPHSKLPGRGILQLYRLGPVFIFSDVFDQRSSPKKWGDCLIRCILIIFYTINILYNSIWLLYIDMCNRLICWLIYTCLRIQMIAKYSYEDMCFVSSAFIFVSIFVRGFENDPCWFHPH